jgi:hypothetical protein
LSGKGDRHRLGVDVAGVLEVFPFPELLEVLRVISGERGRIDLDDVVLHEGEGVVGKIGRAGPDRGAIANDEFAVHELHPGDAPPGIT